VRVVLGYEVPRVILVWTWPMTAKAIIEKVGRPSEPLIPRRQIPTHVVSLRIDRTPNLEHDVTGQRYGEFGTNLRRCKLEHDLKPTLGSRIRRLTQSDG
jgi:hypothetical protein